MPALEGEADAELVGQPFRHLELGTLGVRINSCPENVR